LLAEGDMTNPRDLVGIFYASNPKALAEMVDECCDVSACEYATLPTGGFYMSAKAVPVPYGAPGDDEEVNFFPKAQFTDSWWPIFFFGENVAWKALGW
jgi:hypothetical protein